MGKTFKSALSVLLFSVCLNGCAYIRGIEFSSTIAQLLSSCDTSVMQGAGTLASPYVICSEDQFANLNSATASEYYVIGRDIEFSAAAIPIANSFSANLDGQNHILSKFYYSRPNESDVGLFKVLSGTAVIQNLILEDFKIAGYENVGTLAGSTSPGGDTIVTSVTVKHSAVSADTSGGGLIGGTGNTGHYTFIKVVDGSVYSVSNAGLFTGTSSAGAHVYLDQSSFQGAVTGTMYLGGISGNTMRLHVSKTAVWNQINVVTDDYANNNLWRWGYGVGGMFGYARQTTTDDSYFIGGIFAQSNSIDAVGTFAGETFATNPINNSYFASNQLTLYGGVGVVNGIRGSGTSPVTTNTIFYGHPFTPPKEIASVTDVANQADLENATTFAFDFTNTWQMANSTYFKFPILKHQSATEPFEGSNYDPTSAEVVQIYETPAVNGLTFDVINSDATADSELTFSNERSIPIFLNSIKMAGIGDAFEVISSGVDAGTCAWIEGTGIAIQPYDMCTIKVRYHPYNTAGVNELHRDSLLVKYSVNEDDETTYIYPIDGQATLVGPLLTAADLAMPNGTINTSASSSVLITNDGLDPGSIISYTSSNQAFTVDDTACPIGTTLASLASCTIQITFSPTAVQTYSGKLTIVYESATNIQKTKVISITGTGMLNPFDNDPSPTCQMASGTIASPFCIYDLEELSLVRDYSSYSFIQSQDIDMAGSGCNSFVPIPSFTGNYDGQNHQLSNYCFDNLAATNVGVFSVIISGTVSNLVLKDFNVRCGNNCAALVGSTASSTFSHIDIQNIALLSSNSAGALTGYTGSGNASYITSSGTVSGAGNTGGIIGYADGGGTVDYSSSSAIVNGNGFCVGGLIGLNEAIVSDSSASGAVTSLSWATGGLVGLSGQGSSYYRSFATGVVTGSMNTGGFVGQSNEPNSIFSECYATGAVIGNNQAGGFLGGGDGVSTDGTINNCYATGNVTATSNVGGFVGASWATISNSFSTGTVTGVNSVGGFVGGNIGAITQSFVVNTTITATGTNVGGFAGYNTAPISNSFSGVRTIASLDNAGGFAGQNTSTIQRSYSLADSITSGTTFNSFVGLNTGTVTNSYYNGDAPIDALATAILSADMDVAGNYPALDFATPLWKMPFVSPGTHVLSPVPAWACGLAVTGMVCP